ncbi:MAG: DNA primase [Anaerolineae bacterium]|nr:DNA primase [Anaerolineae bacterium]
MSVVEEIKARLDIVEVIGAYVSLQKAGRNMRAICPFHSEKTPSFYVFADSQRWHCFGACAEGGDVFSFLMKQEGWDFRTTLEELARRTGVELKPRTPAEVEAEEAAERLREVLEATVRYYQQLLLHAPEAAAAREYVARRGLSQETVERFQLGYSLPGWTGLRTRLAQQGYSVQELVRAGLLVEREDGSTFDRFRDRLMIPIRDSRGRAIGFGARTLNPDDAPKYMNSPQTELFDKGRTLYGLDVAGEAIRQQGRVVIVEGYMDVMQAHQAGFGNVIAQMGTALTEAQVRRLKRYTHRFVLALDADAAGVQATLRGIEVTRETLDREWEPVFNPRGLVGFEGRLGAEIRVLSLPAGYDPDDLIRSDPARWQALVDQAAPLVEFYMQTLVDGAELDNAKERARVVDAMLPILRDVADPVERETYAQKLARLLRIDARTVLDRLLISERRSARHAALQAATAPAAGAVKADLEAYCLAMFLSRPQLLEWVNQKLQELEITPLQKQDFVAPAYQAVFQAWEDAAFDQALDSDWLEEIASADVAQRLVSSVQDAGEITEEQWLRDGVQAVLRLRERNLRRLGSELRMLVQDVDLDDQPAAAAYGRAMEENARTILRIQQILLTREWIEAGAAAETRQGERE